MSSWQHFCQLTSEGWTFARLFCLPTTVPSYSCSLCFQGIPRHVSFGISLKKMPSNNDSWHFQTGISCVCCPSVIHSNWQQLRTIPEKNSYLRLCWRTTEYWNWIFVNILCIFKVHAFGGSWLLQPSFCDICFKHKMHVHPASLHLHFYVKYLVWQTHLEMIRIRIYNNALILTTLRTNLSRRKK